MRCSVVAILGLTLVLAVGASGCGGSDGGGVIRPVSGGFQVSDPPGTYWLVFVVFEDGSDTIDVVELACQPGGEPDAESRTVGSNVKIDEGAFTVDHEDVSIDGSFVSPTLAEGTIRAKTETARSCGVPGEDAWAAQRNLDVEKIEGGWKLTRP